MAKLEKTTIYDEGVEDRINVLVTDAQKQTIANYARATGIRGASTFMRSLALGEIQHPNAQSTAANKSAIAFDLNEGDLKGLGQLAAAMYHDDANDFVKILVKAAIDAGPDGIRRFMYGLNERDLSDVDKARALLEKRVAEHEAQETAPRKIRKAA